jgi:hypothetical protein
MPSTLTARTGWISSLPSNGTDRHGTSDCSPPCSHASARCLATSLLWLRSHTQSAARHIILWRRRCRRSILAPQLSRTGKQTNKQTGGHMEGPYPSAVAPQGRRHRDAIPGQNLFADGASRVGTSTRTAVNARRGNTVGLRPEGRAALWPLRYASAAPDMAAAHACGVRSAVPASVHDGRDRRVHAHRNTVCPLAPR